MCSSAFFLAVVIERMTEEALKKICSTLTSMEEKFERSIAEVHERMDGLVAATESGCSEIPEATETSSSGTGCPKKAKDTGCPDKEGSSSRGAGRHRHWADRDDDSHGVLTIEEEWEDHSQIHQADVSLLPLSMETEEVLKSVLSTTLDNGQKRNARD